MERKIWFKVGSGFCLNLGASWCAAVLILPNFISVEKATIGLTGAVLNGTLLIVLSYFFEQNYESYK